MATTHVLIADDNGYIRKLVCQMFSNDKRFDQCSEAENGAQAIEFADRHHPDIIVMDFSMPILDGVSAATLIRQAHLDCFDEFARGLIECR